MRADKAYTTEQRLNQLVNGEAWIYVNPAGGSAAFATDWANYGHSGAALAFRGQAGCVEINGVVAPSAGAGSTLFTLPAAYWPVSIQMIPGGNVTAGQAGWWVINATGTVVAANSIITSDEYFINGRYSLTI